MMTTWWLVILSGMVVAASQDAMDLTQTPALTFTAGRFTTFRRTQAVQQLVCVRGDGCHLQHLVHTVQCTNQGAHFDGNVQWKCTTDLDSRVMFGRTDVVCEGYSSSIDHWKLHGSCGLVYELWLTQSGHFKIPPPPPVYKYTTYNPAPASDGKIILLFCFFAFLAFLWSQWDEDKNSAENSAEHSAENRDSAEHSAEHRPPSVVEESLPPYSAMPTPDTGPLVPPLEVSSTLVAGWSRARPVILEHNKTEPVSSRLATGYGDSAPNRAEPISSCFVTGSDTNRVRLATGSGTSKPNREEPVPLAGWSGLSETNRVSTRLATGYGDSETNRVEPVPSRLATGYGTSETNRVEPVSLAPGYGDTRNRKSLRKSGTSTIAGSSTR